MFGRFSKTLANIAPYIFSKEHTIKIAGNLVMTGTGIFLNFVKPYLFARSIHAMQSENGTAEIYGGFEWSTMTIVAATGAVDLVRMFVSDYRMKLVASLGPDASRKFVVEYVDHVVHQSATYHNTTKYGDHMARLSPWYDAIGHVTNQVYNQLIPTTAEMFVAGAILGNWYGAEVGASVSGTVLLYLMYCIKSKKTITDAREVSAKIYTVVANDTERALKNVLTAQAFNNEELEVSRIRTSLGPNMDADSRCNYIAADVAQKQNSITSLGLTAASLFVATAVAKNQLTNDDYVLCYIYLQQFFGPLSQFGTAVIKFVDGVQSLVPVFTHLEEDTRVVDHYPNTKLNLTHPQQGPEIEFKDVVFGYNPNNLVLKKISFVAAPGKKIGFVGPSGAGKSTVANLLYRFSDPQSGKILIDGQDISKIGLHQLRKEIGLVQQRPVLFNESIYRNVEYGGLSRGVVKKEDVAEALRLARLYDFVESLPDKDNTLVGEQGSQLSGGQAQRINIARVFMKKAKILICDEATAALDNQTEREIQANIDQIVKENGITQLVIAHRLQTVMDADLIIVMKEGCIVERGTHKELLDQKGEYFNLWNNSKKEKADSKSLPTAHVHRFFSAVAAEDKKQIENVTNPTDSKNIDDFAMPQISNSPQVKFWSEEDTIIDIREELTPAPSLVSVARPNFS